MKFKNWKNIFECFFFNFWFLAQGVLKTDKQSLRCGHRNWIGNVNTSVKIHLVIVSSAYLPLLREK